jgi:FtsZ-binding cell division protein ZapB
MNDHIYKSEKISITEYISNFGAKKIQIMERGDHTIIQMSREEWDYIVETCNPVKMTMAVDSLKRENESLKRENESLKREHRHLKGEWQSVNDTALPVGDGVTDDTVAIQANGLKGNNAFKIY